MLPGAVRYTLRAMRLAALWSLAFAMVGTAGDKASFTKSGELVRPTDYREWIFLSSGLGMTYGPNAPAAGAPLRFDNVYVNPSSYREFLRTGKWTDGTVLILEIRESESKGSINQHGHYQKSVAAIEAHVKDSKRFAEGGWAFFDLSPKPHQRPTVKAIAPGNRCQECHSKHGAVDDTFVQFYPDLIPIAAKFGTLKPTPSTVPGH
jgi:hypothetical protein